MPTSILHESEEGEDAAVQTKQNWSTMAAATTEQPTTTTTTKQVQVKPRTKTHT